MDYHGMNKDNLKIMIRMVKSFVNCIRRKLTRNKRSIRRKLTRNKRSTGGAGGAVLTVQEILGISELIGKNPKNIPNVPNKSVPVENKPPKSNAKINQIYENGDTKLIIGIKRGDKKLIHQALSWNPFCIKSKEGKTPLELAEKNSKISSDPEIMSYLKRSCLGILTK